MKIRRPEKNLIDILLATILNFKVSGIEVEYSTGSILKDTKGAPGKALTGIKSIKFEIEGK